MATTRKRPARPQDDSAKPPQADPAATGTATQEQAATTQEVITVTVPALDSWEPIDGDDPSLKAVRGRQADDGTNKAYDDIVQAAYNAGGWRGSSTAIQPDDVLQLDARIRAAGNRANLSVRIRYVDPDTGKGVAIRREKDSQGRAGRGKQIAPDRPLLMRLLVTDKKAPATVVTRQE